MSKRLGALAIQAVAIFTLAAPSLSAGEYSHRIWRAEDGLPRNRIQAIDQTPDGYLWIGTSGGLARFDGVRFVVFDSSNTPALRDESITSLWPAHDGSLWAGTEGGGLLHYQNGSFTSFGTAEGLTNGFVRSVLEDKAGNIWVGTDRGFFQLVKDRFKDRFVRLDHGTPESPFASVVDIAFDAQGRVWVGTQLGLADRRRDGMIVPATCHGERDTSGGERSLSIERRQSVFNRRRRFQRNPGRMPQDESARARCHGQRDARKRGWQPVARHARRWPDPLCRRETAEVYRALRSAG